MRGIPEDAVVESVYGGPAGLARQRKREEFRRLMEEVVAARAEAVAAAAGREGGVVEGDGGANAAGVVQGQRQRASMTATAMAELSSGGYWTRGKATLWGVVAGIRYGTQEKMTSMLRPRCVYLHGDR